MHRERFRTYGIKCMLSIEKAVGKHEDTNIRPNKQVILPTETGIPWLR